MKTRLFVVLFALMAFLPLSARAVEVERVVSDKGIEAWLVQDHQNPIISMSFTFRGGAVTDPEGKAGLAHMVSGLLDEGAGELDSYAFQKKLEDLAVHLGFSASRDYFGGSLKTLTENAAEAFDMLRLALAEPRFDAEPVERVRAQILTGLARELQDPDVIASRTWFETVFADHPYGTPINGYPQTVKAITADDLAAFAKGRFARDNLVVGVVGDVTPEQLKPLLDKAFGALPEKSEPIRADRADPKFGGVKLVKRDIPQSVVVFGEDGIRREDPDWYAAYILNYILGGGGFSSRLMEEVREKRGLAYGVYSYLEPMEYAALLAGGVATENRRVRESIELVRSEWRRMAEQGPTEEELANAKTYLTGSFPLQLSSTMSIAQVLVSMQLHDLGIDYLDKRNDYIEAVTLEDVRRVARELLDPSKLTAVVVGNPQGLETTN